MNQWSADSGYPTITAIKYVKKEWTSFLPGIFWTLLVAVLLTLPGSAFPEEDWLDKIWFDKWVHIGLFAAFVVIWSWGFKRSHTAATRLPAVFLLLAILSAIYGTGMEFVQKYWVTNRSFDGGDILADLAGAILGYFFSRRVYIKK